MSDIFASEAPKYWAQNIPAIPLKTGDKMPAIARWQLHADVMPTTEEQQVWLKAFPNGNIGLPLGPCSGIVALDIDTDDEKVLDVLSKIIPISPWVRRGQKGAVLTYAYGGQRTFNILGADRKMLVQCLSKGAQIALPPSIHPATKQPYVATCELLDVIKALPSLPDDVENIIRRALKDNGFDVAQSGQAKISTFIPAGARDNAMVAHAGILARAVTRGERTLLEALQEMDHWVRNFTEKVAGDDISPEKAQGKVIQFVVRDVTTKGRTLPAGWDRGLTDEDKQKMGLTFTKDQEKWPFEKILAFSIEEFGSMKSSADPRFLQTVDIILGQLVKNDGVTTIQRERMLKVIIDNASRTLTVASLRKRLAEIEKGEMAGANHTELAQAVLSDFTEFGEVRFYADKFHQWGGAYWKELPESAIARHIALEYGACDAARKQNDHSGIIRVMRGLAAKDLRVVDLPGLNFANGYLTANLDLLPHNPDYGTTYVLPYRYLPEQAGNCPMFMQYLRDCWEGDPDFQDKVLALQEALAATMFGLAPKFQRAFCLYGPGGTGKTRLIEIMKGLLPEKCWSSIPPQDWNDKFLKTELFGKLVNICGELPEQANIHGDAFKQVVEGASIPGQYKGRQVFHFSPICAHWFATNHMPRTRDATDGFNRRWLFFYFKNVIPEHKRIIDLEKVILENEREAIAAWAAQGMVRLMQYKHYTQPTSHMALTDQMANDNNSVRYWLNNSPQVKLGRFAEGGSVPESKLHGAYTTYCLSSNTGRPVFVKEFHRRMQDLQGVFGFRQIVQRGDDEKTTVVYQGISLVERKAA